MQQRGKSGDVLSRDGVGELRLNAVLAPGDLVYLPRGFPHRTMPYVDPEQRRCAPSSLDESQQCTGSPNADHAQFSVSVTLSLHTEGIGLTVDKLARCLLGGTVQAAKVAERSVSRA